MSVMTATFTSLDLPEKKTRKRSLEIFKIVLTNQTISCIVSIVAEG